MIGDNGAVFSKYVDLIQRAWDHDALSRPTAQVRPFLFYELAIRLI